MLFLQYWSNVEDVGPTLYKCTFVLAGVLVIGVTAPVGLGSTTSLTVENKICHHCY